jgi:hypothetical protein
MGFMTFKTPIMLSMTSGVGRFRNTYLYVGPVKRWDGIHFATYSRFALAPGPYDLRAASTQFLRLVFRLWYEDLLRPIITAQINDVRCKVVCHNLCCLVQAAFEQQIKGVA